jgi:hypothetical protein
MSSSSGTIKRQPSIDTIRENVDIAQPMHLTVTAPDPPHTRRLSLVSTASQYSTYSYATTLPSIEGSHLDFDTLSVQFDALMRQLESAPEPAVETHSATVSRATTSASKASSSKDSRPAPSFVSPVPTLDVPVANSAAMAVKQEAAGAEVPRQYLTANHHRRTSSMSSTSTLGPETNSEHFTVSAFPKPPSLIPLRPDAGMPPTSPSPAKQSFKTLAVPETMNHGSPKHASWTGTVLYIDSTKVAQTKETQPDLESQHHLEKAGARITRDRQRKQRSIAFGCALYFLPILIMAIIILIIFLIARYH